jgi:hypothetical protein
VVPVKATDRYAAYSSLGLGALCLVYAASAFSPRLLLASALLLSSAAVLFKTGDWAIPALLSRVGLFPAFEGLVFREDAVLVKAGEGFAATGLLKLRVTRSVAGMKEGEKALFISAFNNFLASADHGFKLCLVACPVDVSKALTQVRVKADELLYRASRARDEGDDARAKKLEEERKHWKDLERRLASERPFDVAFYLQVTARAHEEGAALARMRAERRRLAGGLASSLGVDALVVRGRDLYKYAEMDLLVPAGRAELKELEW